MGMMSSDPTNTLWIPLAEKAYVEFNEIVEGGGYGTNHYGSIEGGVPGAVYTQVLDCPATYYDLSSQQSMIDAIDNHLAVGICTNGTTDPSSGLYAGHAYAVIGYDNTSGTFTLYNPWGFDQPGPLTWTQLQQNCWGFQTVDPSGTIAFSSPAQFGAIAADAGDNPNHRHKSNLGAAVKLPSQHNGPGLPSNLVRAGFVFRSPTRFVFDA